MKEKLRTHWIELLFFGFWLVYFIAFWSRAAYIDSSGNFWFGNVNMWGDWAAHFTMGNAMAVRGLFIRSPFLLGANFSYPFVADYISALLMNVGVALIPAFVVPSFFFSMMLVCALYFFYKKVFHSVKIAALGTCLFLFNGGIGFYYFLQDVRLSAQPLFTFLRPMHEYTRIDDLGIKWLSVIDSMIIPQRSFALGFSFALIGLALVFHFFFEKQKKAEPKVWQLIGIGLLFGFLPILHTHSFLATFIFLAWWMVIDLRFVAKPNDRGKHVVWWSVIALSTSLIALPLLKTFFFNNVDHDFFKVQLGWMASEFNLDWLTFTWRNWGVTPILAILGIWVLFKQAKQKLLAVLLLPSFLIFGLSNIFLFQPWSWDNTKLLVWFLLGSSGIISYLLVHICERQWRTVALQKLKLPLAVIIFLVVAGSGMIDAYRVQILSLHSYIEYNENELALANWVKTNTSKNSIWLTGHEHNTWLFNLTGRQPVMAYPGWLWTQGYNYYPVQLDVQEMYVGDSNSEALLKKYGVNYVIIGPNERNDLQGNDRFFGSRFPVAFRLGETIIYKVTD